MKILHIIDQISQTNGGGSANAAYNIARVQAQLGHEVTIYSSNYCVDSQKPPDGVNMVLFDCKANIRNKLIVAPDMLFADYNCDIMHLHNCYTLANLIASSKKGIPYVLQPHGSCLPRPFSFMWNRMIRRADACIADAELELDQFVCKGVDIKKMELIPVGINLKEFEHLPKRKPSKSKHILFVGRFDKVKGLDMLIKAFSRIDMPDVRLQIVGVDYGIEAECRKLVHTLEIEDKVVWLGPLYGTDKIRVMTQADVVVMPSRYEMWGIVFMEALACGTPVVMTDCCEAAKYLLPECGRVSMLNDAYLASVIRQVLNDDLASKYRAYRREWVSQYSWDKLVPRTIELYQEVLNENRKC